MQCQTDKRIECFAQGATQKTLNRLDIMDYDHTFSLNLIYNQTQE